jgi:poly(3-hydroxybutyrate) depolymerase
MSQMSIGASVSIGRLFAMVVGATLVSAACDPRTPLGGAGMGGGGGSAGGVAGSAGGGVGSGATAGASGSSAGTGGAAGATGGAVGIDAAGGDADTGFEAGAPASDGGAGEGGDAGMVPVIHRGGCDTLPTPNDSTTRFVQKVIMVSGIDPAFIAKFPVNTGAMFNWTRRNFYVRLPVAYDPSVAYPVDLEGSGCAGGETTGSAGEFALPATAGQREAIQVGLSYVTSAAATPDCPGWAYDYPDSPELAYLHAVIAAVEANYCVDKSKVFINGYSESGVLAGVAGCANADEIRAFGVQIGGGLPLRGPACKALPVAAMYVVGTADQGEPIGPLATPQNDTIGSVASRDELLHRNGCVAPDFQIVDTCPAAANLPCAAGVQDGDTFSNVPHAMWDPAFPKCQMYTGCPAKFPVVWCPLDVNHGNGPHPMGADGSVIENYRRTALWKFFSTLPAP